MEREGRGRTLGWSCSRRWTPGSTASTRCRTKERMKVSRILVLQERAAGGRELRFNVLDHAVEFDFRPPELVVSRQVDASSYAAVAAPVACARPDLLDIL